MRIVCRSRFAEEKVSLWATASSALYKKEDRAILVVTNHENPQAVTRLAESEVFYAG